MSKLKCFRWSSVNTIPQRFNAGSGEISGGCYMTNRFSYDNQTTKAEVHSMSETIKEAVHLRGLVETLGVDLDTTKYTDSQSCLVSRFAIDLAKVDQSNDERRPNKSKDSSIYQIDVAHSSFDTAHKRVPACAKS